MTRPSDDPAGVRRTQQTDLARSIPLGVIVPLEMSVLARLARILGAGRMALSSVILLPRSIAAERERFATPS